MAKFTITPPKYLTPEDVDTMSIADNWWQIFEIRENIKNLVAKNNILPDELKDLLPLKSLCNHEKYREILERRNTFLERHQVMDANEFAKLFWNDDLQNKEINNNKVLISGKYNKADINQWKLWICVFDTFLKQLKETPFFETLIRCSLQRNETNDWWKCLIPFCNDEWKYEEISDVDIDYLKNSEYKGKFLISDTSLWFNILETLLVKMIWNKKRYSGLAVGFDGNRYLWNTNYDNLKALSIDDLVVATYGLNVKPLRDIFLWENTIKSIWVLNFNDEELEWIIKLTKTWIIKLTASVTDGKINNYIKNNIPNYGNKQVINHDIDGKSNEKTLIERWYPLNVTYQAWPDEEVSIWIAKNLWTTFKIKWTNEWFVPWHAYSIEWIHKKNGETFVTIINPRYTWKKIDVPLKYIKEFFSIWIYWFDFDNMFVENPKDQKK